MKENGSLTTQGKFLDLGSSSDVTPFEQDPEIEEEIIEYPAELEELTLGGRQRSTVMQSKDFDKI